MVTATVRWGIAIALVFALTLRVVFLQTRISQLEAAGTNRMVRAEARSNFEIDFPGVEDGQTTKQMQSNTHICDQDSTKSTEAEWKSPVVVAICLSNASPDNIEEIEVALKSLLYQSPPIGARLGLDVYIVATDEDSRSAVMTMLKTSKLDGTEWPIPIRIMVYDVSAIAELGKTVFRSKPMVVFHIRHYIGAFWRLLLPWILPKEVKHVLYVDLDVWFRDNVAGAWLERNDSTMYQWGLESRTSGVMLMNMHMMSRHLWQSYAGSVCAALRENRNAPGKENYPLFQRSFIHASTGDQAFLQTIVMLYSELEGILSKPYSELHLATAWKLPRPKEGGEWYDAYEGGAIMHMNGQHATARIPFFGLVQKNQTHVEFKEPKDVPLAMRYRIWRGCTFFVDMPWHWLLFHGTIVNRVLATDTYPLEIKVVEKTPEDAEQTGITRLPEVIEKCYALALELTNTTESCRTVTRCAPSDLRLD